MLTPLLPRVGCRRFAAMNRSDEELESIPWNALLVENHSRERWIRFGIVGGLVVAAILGLSRLIQSPAGFPEQVMSAPSISTNTVIATENRPVDVPEAVEISEADLLAVEPEALHGLAAAGAEWFLRDYYTIDQSTGDETGDQRSFVEGIEILSVESLDGRRFAVKAVVHRLSANGGNYVREKPAGAEIVILIDEGSITVVDLPTPISIPDLETPVPNYDPEPLPAPILEAAVEVMEPWGTVQRDSVSGARVGDTWRVTGSVLDRSGIAWSTVAWLTGDGELVPAGG